MATRNRRPCAFCSQELAPTAFYRHLHDKTGTVCPGKRKRDGLLSDDDGSESEGQSCIKSPRTLDSTFELGSNTSQSENEFYTDNVLSSPPASEKERMSFTTSDSEDSTESSLDEEVWDDTESDDENPPEDTSSNSSVNTVVSGISFFLLFFHLVYRLSERAVGTLLGFICALINFLALTTGHGLLLQIAQALPKTMHTIRRASKKDDYVEYVVCSKCSSLYRLSECISDNHGQQESKRCTYVEFPDHPHLYRRDPCNEILLKRVKISNKYKLVPRKVYVYRSILQSLKDMAKREGFLDKCDHWRSRGKEGMENVMGDIYDGRLWNDLQTIKDRPFLAIPNNLCLSLNIDWFNPFEESPYSAGAIYLCVLNLPRSERYKEENVILAGMIPGPNEPKQHINTFLSPLVQDLQTLFNGITFQNPSAILGYTTLRATLACIACDLPATRKICGFANFNATFGCSKCKKMLVTSEFGGKPSYGGFDCNNWIPRDMSSHRHEALKYKEAHTNAERVALCRKTGVKYSELLVLPHFNIIRCHVIDPMHCIFLGLAKHTIKTWKEKGILQTNHFNLLQEKVNKIVPPSKIGRIPRKIECSFASFTADEWKNWILLYSVFALYGIIDDVHYKCWCLLVDSCYILCQPIISTNHIDEGHILLTEFCLNPCMEPSVVHLICIWLAI